MTDENLLRKKSRMKRRTIQACNQMIALAPYWLATFYRCSPVEFLQLNENAVVDHILNTAKLIQTVREAQAGRKSKRRRKRR